MTDETIVLKFDERVPYAATAQFFSIMAFPMAKDEDVREIFRRSLCRWAIDEKASRDMEWATTPQFFIPETLMVDIKKNDVVRNRGSKLLLQYFACARYIVWPAITHANSVEGFVPSVSNMAQLIASKFKMSEHSESTIKHHWWGRMKPIAHLATAWVAWRFKRADGEWNENDFFDAFWNTDDLQDVLKLAAELRPIILAVDHFKITEAQMLHEMRFE